jgi:hypothetical protein
MSFEKVPNLSNNEDRDTRLDLNQSADQGISRSSGQHERISKILFEQRKKRHESQRAMSDERRRELLAALSRQAIASLPEVESFLDRALSTATKTQYLGNSIAVSESDLPFWHFDDLQNAVSFLVDWKEYLPTEKIEKEAKKLRFHSETVKAILQNYRTDWAAMHEDPLVTNTSLVMLLADLRTLDPEDFDLNLLNVTDEEFRKMGSDTSHLRDGLSQVRALQARAKLAGLDPSRFRKIFGDEYDTNHIAATETLWEAWDREHAMDVPKCSAAWKKILEALQSPGRSS